ncbi:DoxX family protein [Candidatus Kaiserbacteria bacterium]|nr:DoxX family protein [Candidatus Kaiserbacteria bacterium]
MEQLIPNLIVLGRLIFGAYWIFSGAMHFMSLNALTGYAQSKGVPQPKLAVTLTGALVILAGIAILFGVYLEWAVLALILFIVPVTLVMHNFWAATDPNMKMFDQAMFFKNIALIGASLFLLALA